jgi:hypothetical protein
MRALGLVVFAIGCGGNSATSGGEVTITNEAGNNTAAHGVVSLEETVAGHLPNNQGALVGELIFNVGDVGAATWIQILFHEPVATGSFVLTTKQFQDIAAGEATLEYAEYGADRTWISQGGTFAITVADPPVVSFELTGAMMMPVGYDDAVGTFTLTASATATEFGVND